MTTLAAPSRAPETPQRLRDRARQLGVAVVRLEASGRATPVAPLPPGVDTVVGSAVFAAAVRRAWDGLVASAGAPVALWPGCWVAALPEERRARPGARGGSSAVPAAVLLGAECLESEAFLRLCGDAEADARAVATRLSRGTLVSAAEAARLAAVLAWMSEDTRQLERSAGDTEQLSQELAESYEEISLLYRLSTSMGLDQPPDAFLRGACSELRQVLDLPWVVVHLIEGEPRLHDLAGRVFGDGVEGVDPDLLAGVGRELAARFAAERGAAPAIYDDTRSLGIPGLVGLSENLIAAPLVSDRRTLAVLFGGAASAAERQITSADAKLCASFASSLTIFLQNLMLYEDAQAMFMGTLHALTSAIDAKDSYTRGHSERVALVSRLLAENAGLDAHTAERVYLSGLVHDVGKIGVPEAVLAKPGRLTAEEFGLIKLHPEIGARILKDIRPMHDLIPGVLHHHEHWNGRGYPGGLAGEEIPLFGRVVGLADAFDAMSSNRTYRAAMNLDRVLEEVRRCAGEQFDPGLAEAFLTLDLEPYYRLIRRHQAGLVGGRAGGG